MRSLKRLKLAGGVTVLIVLLVGLRYFGAVVRMYGLTSPITYSSIAIEEVIGRTVAADLVRWLPRNTPRSAVAMENQSGGIIRKASREDVGIEPNSFVPDPSDTLVTPGLLTDLRTGQADARRSIDEEHYSGPGWMMPSGDRWSRKRSGLNSIDRSNVAELELLYRFDASAEFAEPWLSNTEAPALAADGLLYWITAGERLVALDVSSGRRVWDLKVPASGYSRRGFYLRERPGKSPILYVSFGTFLAAVDGATGRLERSFGKGGLVSLPGPTMLSPVVYGNELIVAVYEPQEIVGLDVLTGERQWAVPLHPETRNFEGGAPWGGLALDRDRALLFVTTGNPRPPLSGSSRPGDNENSNSVIAIDLAQRQIRWSFQEVKHGLWDFDIPSGPILTTIAVQGRRFDVVVAVTKIGNTLILDRESGQPLFDYRLRRAPTSTMANEATAAYQPDLRIPVPLIQLAFDTSMVTDVSINSTRFVNRQLTSDRTLFGRFVPPALNRDLVTFGLHGGAEWYGASVDTPAQRLYVAVNMVPWALRLYLVTLSSELAQGLVPNRAYSERCAGCHLPSRDGEFVRQDEAAVRFIPSLHGYTFDETNRSAFTVEFLLKTHGDLSVSPAELDSIWESFATWDDTLLELGALELAFHWRPLLDQDGLPASAPPWGKIVALDLSTGLKQWEASFGEKTIAGRVEATGSPSFGGLVSSDGGLVFATGTDDSYIRALDDRTGETLWQHRMVAAGSAPPTTFEYRGRQYLAVVATGGKYHNFVDRANALYVFGLPDRFYRDP